MHLDYSTAKKGGTKYSDLSPGQSHLNPDAKISHEGHPLGAPLPIVSRSRLKNRSRKGLFSAVFSELGSNQVGSRVLAQLDAIALGWAGGWGVGSGGRAAVERPNRYNLLERVRQGFLKSTCGGLRGCNSRALVREMYERLREIGQKNFCGRALNRMFASGRRASRLGHMLWAFKGGQRSTGNNLARTVRRRPFGGGR